MNIKKLTTVAELEDMQGLEKEIWEMDPIPIHQTLTATKNGGIILGAYEGDQMAGFLYSFPGFKSGRSYLCSHILGIKPEFQKKKIGEQLKRTQYQLALEAGFSSIVWTYDPLLSVNAYLNLHKLGANAVEYIENNYGEMTDSLNAGLPSDRFLVEWPLPSTPRPLEAIKRVTEIGDAKLSTSKHWYVPIPRDFQKMRVEDPELALDWRLKTRAIFKDLLSQGFVGVDLIQHDENVSYYLFVLKED